MYSFGFIGSEESLARHREALGSDASINNIVPATEGQAPDISPLLLDKELDTIIVAHQPGYHAEAIIKILQARKHVVCEAPLCITSAAAWQIIETAKFCRKEVFVFNPNRYQQAPTEETFKGNYHLQVQLASAKASKPFPHGDLLYDLTDIIDHIVQKAGIVDSVRSFLHRPDEGERDKSGVAIVEHAGGILGTINWKTGTATNVRLISNDNETILTSGDNGSGALGAFYRALMEFYNGDHSQIARVYEGMETVTLLDRIYQTALT